VAPKPSGFLGGSIDGSGLAPSFGSKPPVVFNFDVTNDGDVPIDGVEVSVEGPMEKFTITGVTAGGKYLDSGLLGRTFDWPLTVPPHDVRSMQIIAFVNEPGSYAFRFGLLDSAGHELLDSQGGRRWLTATVSLTR
jgi:hypothetical protein